MSTIRPCRAAVAASLLLTAAVLPPPAVAQQDARPADLKLMECQLVGQVTAGVEEGLGPSLVIGLDAAAGVVTVDAPSTLAAPGAAQEIELVWLGEDGLRAVAVVVRNKDLPERPPVAVLDLDYADARMRYGTFGGAWDFESDLYPTEYSCRRLN